MNLGKPLHVSDLAERVFEYRISDIAPTHSAGWIISFQHRPEVVILDSDLNELQWLDLQAGSELSGSSAVAMSQAGQFIALSDQTDLRIFSRCGTLRHRIPHRAPWGTLYGSNCFFDGKNRLWYVQPGDEIGTNDCLTIIEPESGATHSQERIANEIGFFHLFPCPDGESVLVDCACGQDGSYLYLAQLSDATLTINQYPFHDRVFYSGFALGGHEFATGAQEGDAIEIHSFPQGQVVASASSETIFAGDTLAGEEPDAIGYQPIYLDDDHILIDTRFGRMLLLHRNGMKLIGTVWPEGYKLCGYDVSGKATQEPSEIVDYAGDLTSLYPAGAGKLLTEYNRTSLRLLDVSSLL